MNILDKIITTITVKALALAEDATATYKEFANDFCTYDVKFCGNIWGAEDYDEAYEMVEQAAESLQQRRSVEGLPQIVRAALDSGTFYKAEKLTILGRLAKARMEWVLRNADKPTAVAIPEVQAQLDGFADLLAGLAREAMEMEEIDDETKALISKIFSERNEAFDRTADEVSKMFEVKTADDMEGTIMGLFVPPSDSDD